MKQITQRCTISPFYDDTEKLFLGSKKMLSQWWINSHHFFFQIHIFFKITFILYYKNNMDKYISFSFLRWKWSKENHSAAPGFHGLHSKNTEVLFCLKVKFLTLVTCPCLIFFSDVSLERNQPWMWWLSALNLQSTYSVRKERWDSTVCDVEDWRNQSCELAGWEINELGAWGAVSTS